MVAGLQHNGYSSSACGDMYSPRDGEPGLAIPFDMRPSHLCDESGAWNPLTHDGDCARLEAHLGITVRWCLAGRVITEGRDCGTGNEEFANHGGNRNAARRRASVCAAVDRVIEELEG